MGKWDKFREKRAIIIEDYIRAKALMTRMTKFRKLIAFQAIINKVMEVFKARIAYKKYVDFKFYASIKFFLHTKKWIYKMN